jgi:nitrogen-specific signal transduction histidine kinase
MSPELVDQTILANCKLQFLEVARVIIDVATALKVPKPLAERLFTDEAPEKPMGTEVDFIANRIKALVKAENLESQGNLDRWRYSEIRLAGK